MKNKKIIISITQSEIRDLQNGRENFEGTFKVVRGDEGIDVIIKLEKE